MSMFSDIVERLKGGETPFAIVERVSDLAAVDDRPNATPAGFVFLAEDASGPNTRATGPILQRLERDIAIVIITDNATSRTMGAASDDMEGVVGWVRSRLLGFEPEGAVEPMEHVSGQLVKARGGAVWWEERFGVAAYLEEASQ